MFDFLGDALKTIGRGSLAITTGGLSETSIGKRLMGAAGDLIFGSDDPQIPQMQPPPPPPDLADQAIQRAALMQRRRQLLGQGMGSMFVSGPLGDMSAPTTAKPAAVGI